MPRENRRVHRELEHDAARIYILPAPCWPDPSDVGHLLFALRTDGLSLPICRALLRVADLDEPGQQIAAEVRRTPTGDVARRS